MIFFSGINSRVERIKNNQEEADDFIAEYKPFIANCVGKAIGRFVEYGKDDELSIGLIAFAEAIMKFDMSKGSFLSFATVIIKNRLIDYYRKEKRYLDNIVLSKSNENGEESYKNSLISIKSMEDYNNNEINELRRLEIIEFSKELAKWDICFNNLINASPKHDKLRRIYKEAIYYVLCNSHLAASVLKKKYLPIAEIEKGCDIPRKKLERGRKYIIASIIILSGDYIYIREFLKADGEVE